MDSILLNNLFQATVKEKKLFSLAHQRSLEAQDGLQELMQQWGEALQDVQDKKAALGI